MPTNKAKTTDGEAGAAGVAKPKRARKAAAPESPQAGAAAVETADRVPKAPRRRSVAPKPEAAAAKAQGANGVSHPPITTEDISVRAYFIAENRQFLGLAGDPESDWLEAERQLKSEAAGIATSLQRR